MLDFHNSDEAGRTASSGKMWENVRKPVMADNSRKWLKGMTQDQIIDFESVAGESLTALGYPLEFVGKTCPRAATTPPPWPRSTRRTSASGRRARRALAEDAAARKPQEDLLARIRSRTAQPA